MQPEIPMRSVAVEPRLRRRRRRLAACFATCASGGNLSTRSQDERAEFDPLPVACRSSDFARLKQLADPVRPSERLRILLVEADARLAGVVARELGRRHRVAVVATIASAIEVMLERKKVDVVIAAYRVDDGTAGKLFAMLLRRWPRVRRIVYGDPRRMRSPATARADAVVDASANFDELIRAVDG